MKILENNTYDSLINCFMVYPCNIKNSKKVQIDGNLAIKQYNNLINTLTQLGTKIHFLDLNNSPAQLFVRDIGFVVDDILFISNMTDPQRKSEIDKLVELAEKHNIKSHKMINKVEGGDILIHCEQIFIGQGDRTIEKAAEEIAEVLLANNKNFEIKKVYFEKSRIHLDCVFNILDKETCVISPDIFNTEDVVKYFSKVIEIPKEDSASLPTNIITPGNNFVLCSSKKFTDTLRDHGFNSIYI